MGCTLMKVSLCKMIVNVHMNLTILYCYCRESYYSYSQGITMFQEPGDWGQELARTAAVGWRVTGVNKDFKMSAR